MVSSPLADFMSRLQEGSTLSVNVAVVSDNARTRTRVVAPTVYSQKPARRSRWGPEKEKGQELSPKVPSRRVNSEHTQRMDEPLPALSTRLQHLGPRKTMDHLLLAE
jgi:hypothetical protein